MQKGEEQFANTNQPPGVLMKCTYYWLIIINQYVSIMQNRKQCSSRYWQCLSNVLAMLSHRSGQDACQQHVCWLRYAHTVDNWTVVTMYVCNFDVETVVGYHNFGDKLIIQALVKHCISNTACCNLWKGKTIAKLYWLRDIINRCVFTRPRRSTIIIPFCYTIIVFYNVHFSDGLSELSHVLFSCLAAFYP